MMMFEMHGVLNIVIIRVLTMRIHPPIFIEDKLDGTTTYYGSSISILSSTHMNI